MSKDTGSQKTPSDSTYKGAGKGDNFDGSKIEKTGLNKDHDDAVEGAENQATTPQQPNPNR